MTIKANELRIGNFITVNNPKWRPDINEKTCIVSGIDTNRPDNYFKSGTSISLYVKDDEYKDKFGQFIEFLQPILLTEEWLVCFGFCKLTPKGSIYGLEDFNIQNFYPLGFFECSNHIKIKSVHQLQNLYLSLTGEELKERSQ